MIEHRQIMYDAGRRNALELRDTAANLTGTEIIDREQDVPQWDAQKDYTAWPISSPVADDDQVWTLIQPHNATHYVGRPSTLRALWGLCHTKDPQKAKPWVDPYGQSGMYMTDECYKTKDGTVYRAKQDNLVYDAETLPDAWEVAS